MKRFALATLVACVVAFPATASAQAPACCQISGTSAYAVNQEMSYVILPVIIKVYLTYPDERFQLRTQTDEPIRLLNSVRRQMPNGVWEYSILVDQVPQKEAYYHICTTNSGGDFGCPDENPIRFYIANPVVRPRATLQRYITVTKASFDLRVEGARPIAFHVGVVFQKLIGRSWETLRKSNVVRAESPQVSSYHVMPTIRYTFRTVAHPARYRVVFRVQEITDLGVVQGAGSVTRYFR